MRPKYLNFFIPLITSLDELRAYEGTWIHSFACCLYLSKLLEKAILKSNFSIETLNTFRSS